jgi:hypothetical protein
VIILRSRSFKDVACFLRHTDVSMTNLHRPRVREARLEAAHWLHMYVEPLDKP